MAAKNRAADAAKAARNNPYLQRLIEDEGLRNNLRDAYESARHAYARLNHGKKPTKQLMDDKRLHKDLKNAADSLRDATEALRQGPKRRRHRGRKLMVLVVGAGLALALSEGLRKTVLDALFGAEEEFEYTSTTAPAGSAPTNSASGSQTVSSST
jgi:hypothetical protein